MDKGFKISVLLSSALVLCIAVGIAVVSFASGEANQNRSSVSRSEIITLYSDHNFPAKAYQPVTIERRLPDDIISGDAIVFRSVLQSVKVDIDGKTIYEYNTDGKRTLSKSTPSAWNFVRLDSTHSGKTVKITYISPYANFSGVIKDVKLGDAEELIVEVVKKSVAKICVSLLLLFLGVTVFFGAIIGMRGSKELFPALCVGTFTILIALWARCDAELPPLFFFNDEFARELGSVILMLAPVPLALYGSCVSQGTVRHIQRALYTVYIINFFVCTFLSILNIYDFTETVPATHCLIVLGMLVLLYTSFKQARKKGIGPSQIGAIMLAVCTGVEFALYYSHVFWNEGTHLMIGVFIYVLCLAATVLSNTLKQSNQNTRLQAELSDSRVMLMISQIQPHFIYNTLNSIRALIKIAPDDAYDMVYDFSRYLRCNIDSIGSDRLVKFSEELSHIRAYTNIEQRRFFGRLNVYFDIAAENFYLPPLSIQPLVENAIKHGVCKRADGGTVTISSKDLGDSYMIQVLDDGVGFDVESYMNSVTGSVGIKNLRLRLDKMVRAELWIDSNKRGTVVTITLPKEFQPKEDDYVDSGTARTML